MPKQSELARSRRTDVDLLVFSILIAYLMGLLMVDIQIDFSSDSTVIKQYYCSLVSSFFTIPGIVRLFLPVIASAVISIRVLFGLFRSEFFSWQCLITCLLVFVGIPSVGVSISLCRDACKTEPNDGPFEVVYVCHLIMLVLFVYTLISECVILHRSLNGS